MGSRIGNGTQTEEDDRQDDRSTSTVMAIAGAAGLAVAAWGMSKLFGSSSESSEERKMMKAPGRDYKIPRDDFEKDPKTYFSNLRNKK